MTQAADPITTEQVDLYREVHKGLRLALFELVEAAGALDGSLPESVAAFQQLFADVDMMLTTHHGHEDGDQLGVLIARNAGAAAELVEEDHDRSEAQLAELRSLVVELGRGGGDAAQVYDAVAVFTAGYLQHMSVEENQVMPALQAAVPVEELTAITMAIRTSVPPPEMCVFLRYMLPAMTPDERTETLRGMKLGAPAEIFDMFWRVAEQSLPSSDVARIAERIAA